MKKAFTMIELVFVIVVIGILATVALPRFMGVSEDAHVTKLQTFVDILNRSVSPSMWSGVLKSESSANGSFANSTQERFNTLTDNVQIDIPELFRVSSFDLTRCAPPGTPMAIGVGKLGDAQILDTTYSVGCIDGGLSVSARFSWMMEPIF